MAPWGRGRLGARLVLAFVGVALAAEAASASVTLLTSRSDLAGLASTQRADRASAVVAALDNAYKADDGWPGADVRPAVALIEVAGSALVVRCPDGARLLRGRDAGAVRGPSASMASRHLSVDGPPDRDDRPRLPSRWPHPGRAQAAH